MQDELDSVSDEESEVEQNDVPIDVTCPNCSSEIEIPKLSTFRCPKCKSVSSIDEDGNISLRDTPSTNFSQKFEEGVDKFSSWIKPTAQKFGEQAERTTQDFVSWGSSAGENISGFSINNDDMRNVRIWIFNLGAVLIWFLLAVILFIVFFLWFSILGISEEIGFELATTIYLFVSYFFILRLYTYCTNNRNFELSSEILSESDPYVSSYLFQFPAKKGSSFLFLKALFANATWFILAGFIPLFIFGYRSLNNIAPSLSDVDLLLCLIILSTCIATPIVEELLFRGFVFDMFSEIYSKWASIIFSSILFGLVHLEPFAVLNAFILGMIYGYVRHETNSLWPSIVLHGLWNLQVVLYVY